MNNAAAMAKICCASSHRPLKRSGPGLLTAASMVKGERRNAPQTAGDQRILVQTFKVCPVLIEKKR